MAAAYANRAINYIRLGNYQQALTDYDKAIQLAPKNAVLYKERGLTYENLGDYRQAIKDYKTAARLGDKDAQDILRSKGISW